MLGAVTATAFALSGCGGSDNPEGTANVSDPLPAPPVAVASSNDGPNAESPAPGEVPDFADELSFSGSLPAAAQPPSLASVTPPGPDSASTIDPLLLPEPAAGDESWRKQWGTDLAAAKVQAQAEGKDILVNFTGSDWCHWCIQLSQEVFSEPGFAEYAKKNFVLVEADFPMNQLGRPEATHPEHKELSEQFEVEGFPTILLFDKQGRPFGRTGYQPGGPPAYNAHLDELRLARVERDEALAAADGLKGVERAKKLDEALASLPSALLFPSYESIVEEIIKLDADNTAELRSQYEDRLANHQFMTQLQAIEKQIPDADNPDAVLDDIAKVAERFSNDSYRSFAITMFRINVLNYFGRVDDVLNFAATALQNESLDSDYRAQLYITQLRVLNQADRQEDAISIIDQASRPARPAQASAEPAATARPSRKCRPSEYDVPARRQATQRASAKISGASNGTKAKGSLMSVRAASPARCW